MNNLPNRLLYALFNLSSWYSYTTKYNGLKFRRIRCDFLAPDVLPRRHVHNNDETFYLTILHEWIPEYSQEGFGECKGEMKFDISSFDVLLLHIVEVVWYRAKQLIEGVTKYLLSFMMNSFLLTTVTVSWLGNYTIYQRRCVFIGGICEFPPTITPAWQRRAAAAVSRRMAGICTDWQ